MSTSIVVMNKSAVALASDSFYTLTLEDESGDVYKTFSTAKNLFKLSDTAPVGIIQFDSPDLMDVPVEVILAMHKDHLGNTKFNRLKEYVMDFIRFLEGNPMLFPPEVQDSFLLDIVSEYFEQMMRPRTEVKNDSGATSSDDPPISKSLQSKIEQHIKILSEVKQPKFFPETFESELLKQKQQVFDEAAESVFEESQLSGPILGSLRQLGGLVATRAIVPGISCGIAFVGYGEEDIFPQLMGMEVDGQINGRLRYREIVNERISRERSAYVFSFDQGEMIETFLNEMWRRRELMFNVVGSLPKADLAKVAEELIKLE
ncbi:MAG: hypothetical protein ABSG91_12555, partial [Syntrophobacteraceae bacterium]